LTATEEKISFEGSDIPTQKRTRISIKFHPLSILRSAALEIELFMRKTLGGIKGLFTKSKEKIISFIESRAEADARKKINTLNVALGALCGCTAVTAVTLGVMFLSLFAPYAVKYETVTVPDLEGKIFSDLEGAFDNINLTVQYENNPDVADGQIISQSAPAGAKRRVNAESGYFDLKVTVCKKETVTIPDGIVGMSLRDAELALKNQGLLYSVAYEYSATSAKGQVINAYPKSGEMTEQGSVVKLTVSLGEKKTELIVPDLEGLDENEAQKRIRLSGFKVGSIRYTPSDKPLGTVVSQSLKPHTYASEGSVISLWVAST
jgi:hypothetical protein